MVVYRLQTELTPQMTSGHYRFPFLIPKNGSRLSLTYRYYPKAFADKASAINLIQDCYARYGINASPDIIEAELPLNNLITLSLDSPSGLAGTAHRHNSEACYNLSAQDASPGFQKTDIIAGQWAVVLTAHAVLSDKVIAEVEIDVI